MVKDHSERKPTIATWTTISDEQQGFFHMHHPTDRITRPRAVVLPRAYISLPDIHIAKCLIEILHSRHDVNSFPCDRST